MCISHEWRKSEQSVSGLHQAGIIMAQPMDEEALINMEGEMIFSSDPSSFYLAPLSASYTLVNQ